MPTATLNTELGRPKGKVKTKRKTTFCSHLIYNLRWVPPSPLLFVFESHLELVRVNSCLFTLGSSLMANR